MNKLNPYPIYSLKFWKAYIIQMRPYLLFVSSIAGTTGIAMASQFNTDYLRIGVSSVIFFMGYGFGQALTDCFQTDTDKLSAPYRPLSKGIITINATLTVSIIGLLCSAIVLLLVSPISFVLSLFAVFGLATYSIIKKKFWFAGPLYNAWIVALLPIMGFFAIIPNGITYFFAHFGNYIAISFFSYANFVLIGYLKDIDADRVTGYKTFPVVLGWKKTVLLGDIFAVIVFVLFWTRNEMNEIEILFGLLGTILLILGLIKGHLNKTENVEEAIFPILSTVRSFILFHIAIVLHYQLKWWIQMSIFYFIFEIALHFRPCRYQV
ncbi:UbiA family prenyltransferase [Flavobacterium maritimum]|uniref:UbiA family prenyltransferase n=1 Tax=Flavobacterium maritimum TaxID=3149042 RepID=UPI0032B548E7